MFYILYITKQYIYIYIYTHYKRFIKFTPLNLYVYVLVHRAELPPPIWRRCQHNAAASQPAQWGVYVFMSMVMSVRNKSQQTKQNMNIYKGFILILYCVETVSLCDPATNSLIWQYKIKLIHDSFKGFVLWSRKQSCNDIK